MRLSLSDLQSIIQLIISDDRVSLTTLPEREEHPLLGCRAFDHGVPR
jgi:hypothetical protein